MTQSRASVLVVDDTPANLEILTQMLKDKGHRPRPVPSGALALRAAEHEAPDLVLMDINMPEMDGFETCRKLKAQEDLSQVPVLFISARSDTYDKIQAFRSGGVDYITKPFDLDEVTARVETHLELARLQAELEQQYAQLGRLERLRDNLVHMVVHDMRSPLSVVKAVLYSFNNQFRDMLDEDSLLDLEAADACSDRLLVMVNNLLDLSRLEAGSMPLNPSIFDCRMLIDETISSVRALAIDQTFNVESDGKAVTVYADRSLVQRVLTNLVNNAIKFSPVGGTITVRHERVDEGVRLMVKDEGPGVDPEYHEHIFEKFGQGDEQTPTHASTGLGLTFCKLAVESHGGQIGIDSAKGRGSTFWFTLPHTPVN